MIRKRMIVVIFILIILVSSLFLLNLVVLNDSKTIISRDGELLWPTYKHDFSRTGNLNLKDYELVEGVGMGTIGS
ncbi:MAG: hypothetical protein GQ477_02840, partial [Nanohaloarchaea archaeon]|nr:hypothetical protein [Candidatus Nanohaloarchaea archaeon]